MIKDNITSIRTRIGRVCSRSNKNLQDITVTAAVKARSVKEISGVIEAGIVDIGANRVQEALSQYAQLSALGYEPQSLKWHFIGHLQTNKVKDAVRIFNLIHSVDSLRLAVEINNQASRINKVQDILIEVNTALDPAKYGTKPAKLLELTGQLVQLKNIRLLGLMTIAPICDDAEESRPYFRQLRELLQQVNSARGSFYSLQVLSMGMSDDFEVAIEEGANIIRLGRALFESQE